MSRVAKFTLGEEYIDQVKQEYKTACLEQHNYQRALVEFRAEDQTRRGGGILNRISNLFRKKLIKPTHSKSMSILILEKHQAFDKALEVLGKDRLREWFEEEETLADKNIDYKFITCFQASIVNYGFFNEEHREIDWDAK